MRNRIGIDLGGTKTEVIAISDDDLVIYSKRVATPKHDYEGVLDAIAELVLQAKVVCSKKPTIGIGIPGSQSPQGKVIQNANSTWMNGRNFLKDISAKLNQDVRLANDANCLALSESYDGVAKNADTVFAVIIGTGCGGGLVVNNKLLIGRHAIGGEWGHTPLPWPEDCEIPAPQCWCGRKGCLELWVSGSGLERDCLQTTDLTLTAAEITTRAEEGDKSCSNLIDNHCNRLARGLAMVTNIIDPDVIVLGGGLSNMQHLYQRLPKMMTPFVFTDNFSADIRAPLHGDASGVRGAARLWD